MKYTGPVYRPPIEANSVLLQVTVGCAHNKCNFCTMYRDVRFCIESIEQIEKDLQEARKMYRKAERFFLVNGDPFVLSANKLKVITKKIIEYFPEVEVITMYASIRNIMNKTDEELKELRDLRINELWVGLETGDGKALKYMNKGFTLEDSYEQVKRLNKAGIKHNGMYILGGSGRGKGIQAAIDTAKLINTTKHNLIGVTSMGAFGDSELAKAVEAGEFVLATEGEILEEEKKLIELIDAEMPFYGDHAINTLAIRGMLPRDRQAIIDGINSAIEKMGEDFLNSVPQRHSI